MTRKMRVNTDRMLCWGVEMRGGGGGIRVFPSHKRHPRFPDGCSDVDHRTPKSDG